MTRSRPVLLSVCALFIATVCPAQPAKRPAAAAPTLAATVSLSVSGPAVPVAGAPGNTSLPDEIIRAAMTYLGTPYVHGGAQDLATEDISRVLAVADAKIFHKSYGDQNGELWSPNGRLLATTTQIGYFKA